MNAPRHPIVTLLTDFDPRDSYIAQMKAVILAQAPGCSLVDLAHGIPPGDVMAAQFLIETSFDIFPPGTVHVCVVDPGVGTDRRILAACSAGHLFLAPDNGLLTFLFAPNRRTHVHSVENDALFRPKVSRTFHGRDLFAPVAARLATGLPIEKVGPRLTAREFVQKHQPLPHRDRSGVRGAVVHIDGFGNAITNIRPEDIEKIGLKPKDYPAVRIRVGRRTWIGIAGAYGEVRRGAPLALLGSSDRLEIAMAQGNAARQWNLKPGTPVTVCAPRRSGRSPWKP